jgi:hypothetical protein
MVWSNECIGLVLVTEAALERLWIQWIAEASKIRRW